MRVFVWCLLGLLLGAYFWKGWPLLLGLLAVLGWVFYRGFQRLHAAQQRGDMVSYQAGSAEQNWALALCHPMAYHTLRGGFAAETLHGADDALTKQLRPMVLNHAGLRTDLSDEQIRQQLPDALRQRWFTLDLQRPHRSDDGRAAMAFACARVAFFVRCAHLLEWLDAEPQWEILLLNAQRAQECFDSWQAFGEACAQGREQWLAQGRGDVLGLPFSAADVALWVTEAQHPWHCMLWSLDLSPHTPQAPESDTPVSLTA